MCTSTTSTRFIRAPSLRVRPFETELALTTYLRLAGADLLVCDFDSESAPADALALRVRHNPRIDRRGLQIVALASTRSAQLRARSVAGGIDEVIMKPMSPKYLVERVLARLAGRPAVLRPPARLNWTEFGDNVVPLFGQAPQPQA